MANLLKNPAEKILLDAGITIGDSPTDDMQVKNEKTYVRALTEGSLGLGESFMDGWWSSPHLDMLFSKITRAGLHKRVKDTFLQRVIPKIFNLQSLSRAKMVGVKHYDLGNDLFEQMLGPTMAYSCGYWQRGAKTLEEAQHAKFDLIGEKMGLEEGMTVLNVGCGFGILDKYLMKKYKLKKVVGITISPEQAEYAAERCSGLPIEIRVQDYRMLDEKFDRIISVGMVEHVGHKNYRTFMETCERCLSDDGLFLLHTIGSNQSETTGDPWLMKYIFPNGMLPSVAQLSAAAENLFVLEDLHNFGADYYLTMMEWYKNFERAWPQLEKKYGRKFKGKFYLVWTYYLLSLAGAFHSRAIQLHQYVYSKKGIMGGHKSVR